MPDTTSPSYPAIRLHGPRRIIGTALLVCLLALLALCLLFTGLIIKTLVEDLNEYEQLTKRGERVEATISARRAGEDESGATYYLTYRFDAGNQTIEQETEVYEYEYKLYSEGMTLTVVYLSDDPNTAKAEMVLIRENRVTWVLLVIIPLGFLGTPCLLFVVWWWIFRRTAVRLRKHGVTVMATITDVRRASRYAPQILTFAFNAKYSNGTTGPIYGQERLLVHIAEFKPGDTISVRYLANNPKIFMIDVESLIEAARK